MSTLKCSNLQNASASSAAITLAADGSATANLSSLNGGALAGMRNRIINGAMEIDQRNAGASVTPTNAQYLTDRWKVGATQSSKFTAQQSTTAPAGFKNSLLLTSSSAYTPTSSDEFEIIQFIEGNNIVDCGFGTANAQTLTLSFYTRSSLTGTFGGCIYNSSANRSYPFAYSISAANTWERKTVTFVGDTSGTWATDNTAGINVLFSLGAGSNNLGTAGAWTGSFKPGATGQTNLVATNGATFYITGVQLEPGSVATPFERRSYGQELALCQRYYQLFTKGTFESAFPNSSVGASYGVTFQTSMRAIPTTSATNITTYSGNAPSAFTASTTNVRIGNAGVTDMNSQFQLTLAAEL